MSTLAIEGSSELDGQRRLASGLRLADLPVLVVALPVFVLADLPMLGWAVCTGAWLFVRGLQHLASRQSARALERGDRRSAMGFHAAAMLARIWVIALAVLAAGLIEREAGLAAAVMAIALVTLFLGGGALAQLLEPTEEQR